MNELVSVVIPIYNVEKYLEECLNSIINQTYTNLEILCIDDCGTDNSINILKVFAEKDKRIKIISNEKNIGLGATRNNGINNASGKYIYFIDSDDFIDLNYIEQLVLEIEKNQVNVVCNNKILKYYDNNLNKNKFIKTEKDFILNTKLNWDDGFLKNMSISAWCKLYNLKFLKENKIYFAENKLIFEDFYFIFLLNTKIKIISFIYNSTYYYRQRENSLINQKKYQKNNCYDSLFIIELLYNYYKENNLLDKYNIPFHWLNKFFHKVINKKEFFLLIKEKFNFMKNEKLINFNNYGIKDKYFFNSIIDTNNYYLFRMKYFLVKIYNKL